MILQRDRTREGAVGLGLLTEREVYPTPGASYQDMGWLDSDGTTIDPQIQVVEHKDEAGDLSSISETESSHKLSTFLAQVGQDEIDFIKGASGKIHSLRYYGMMNPWRFQYNCTEQAQIVPTIPRTWKAGKQNLPMTAYLPKQSNLAYSVPECYLIEAMGRMHLDDLIFWASPRRKWNDATAKILDASGFAYHGDLSSGFTTIWQTATLPERFLRFNGSSDYANFGDVCDLGTNDAIVECWVRIQGANGTLQEILSKKDYATPYDPGFALTRDTSNKAHVYVADGTNNYDVPTTTSVLQNTWVHVLFHFYRVGGVVHIYLNGSDEGNCLLPANSLSNSNNLFLALYATGYGQVDKGDIRIHSKATALDAATMALDHYNAEKSYYPNS